MYGYNYYNPFIYQALKPRGFGGLFKNALQGNNVKGLGNLFHKINFNSILTGTSKTLNVINQAIPIYYQVKPMFKNAKTMFKIVNAVKSDNIPNQEISITNNTDNNVKNTNNYQTKNYENPIFFI